MKDSIFEKTLYGERISKNQAVRLFSENLSLLGYIADEIRKRKSGDVVTFVIDRNINYTKFCLSRCRFCAYYSETPEKPVSVDEIVKKVAEAVEVGATQILMQGGLNPDVSIEYLEEIFRAIKNHFPDVQIHSLSPPEIDFLSRNEGMTIEETLLRLKDAGLGSLPGGGAEILVDRVRKEISPNKISSRRWLRIMRIAHSLGLPSSATMMFGHVESYKDRVEHLHKIRRLQDKTGGFTAFIPWTFYPFNTELYKCGIIKYPAGGVEYLKTLAISRIFLDNFRNLQVSWVSQGERVAQLALRFGANDFGGTMLEENVMRAAGKVFSPLSPDRIIMLIRSMNRIPAQRDTLYNILQTFA